MHRGARSGRNVRRKTRNATRGVRREIYGGACAATIRTWTANSSILMFRGIPSCNARPLASRRVPEVLTAPRADTLYHS